MTHTRSEIQAIVIPIAGVCNVGLTANELFQPMRTALERDLDIPVLNPFVPGKLGIQQPLHRTVEDFHEHMMRVSQAFPGARRVFIGHSLGGILAQEYIAASQEPDAVGSIAIASPLGGLNEHHWLVHRDRVREINSMSKHLQSSIAPLVQLGVQHDTVVPWQSALANIEGGSQYLQKTHCTIERRMARVALAYAGLGRGVVEHNAVLREPANIALISHLTGTLFERAGITLPQDRNNFAIDLAAYSVAA